MERTKGHVSKGSVYKEPSQTSSTHMELKKIQKHSIGQIGESEESLNYSETDSGIIGEGLVQYIPENLNINNLILDYPTGWISKFSVDKLIHIIHLLFSIPANNKDLEIIKGFVPVYSKILKRRIPNYRQYLEYLIAAGVIETDNWYIVGNKSKGYRFQKRYCRDLKPIKIFDKILIKHQRAESRYSASMKKSYNHLIKWFDYGLEINYDLAMDFIHTDRNRKTKNTDLWDKDLKSGLLKQPWNQYYSAYINIERIANKDFYMNVDTNVYRFHSNLTNLRSELRNCLSYLGQPLISIDITNSQPYLSTVLLNKGFWGYDNQYMGIRINELKHNTLKTRINIENIQNNFTSIMWQESNIIHTGKDLQLYTDLVVQGNFYEYLSRLLEEELGSSYKTRKEVKRAVFQVLFTANQFIGQKEAAPKRIFRDKFPNVYNIFSIIKKEDKTLLPRLLQRIESELVLRRIAKRISKERPDLPIFTVHDSIATTIGNELYVKNVMEEVLCDSIGCQPQLKVEKWHPSLLKFRDNKLFIAEEEIKVA